MKGQEWLEKKNDKTKEKAKINKWTIGQQNKNKALKLKVNF